MQEPRIAPETEREDIEKAAVLAELKRIGKAESATAAVHKLHRRVELAKQHCRVAERRARQTHKRAMEAESQHRRAASKHREAITELSAAKKALEKAESVSTGEPS